MLISNEKWRSKIIQQKSAKTFFGHLIQNYEPDKLVISMSCFYKTCSFILFYHKLLNMIEYKKIYLMQL